MVKKMAQGRSSAATMLLLCMLVLYSEMVHAATYVVGDATGWAYNVNSWPNGKSFKAGDILEFKYSPFAHNVIQVDEFGYNTCIPTFNSRLFFSGDDHIQLAKGLNYFICGFPGHCQLHGMRIAVNATA
ncbi:hypothetical protein JHK82_036531 [Glycine max]|nr:hypothetical protein JHK85_037258 [Glycine max]KAG5113262.1 hypothetical protein JHK82_036531 [Glycine max]